MDDNKSYLYYYKLLQKDVLLNINNNYSGYMYIYYADNYINGNGYRNYSGG